MTKSFYRRSRIAMLLLGAAPALMLAAAQPAQAGGGFFSMRRCADDNPRHVERALTACSQVIGDAGASISEVRRALSVRGGLRSDRGDLTGALNDLLRAVELGDASARTYLALGRVQLRLNAPEAVAILTEAERLASGDRAVLFEIGLTLGDAERERRNWAPALDAYTRAFANAANNEQRSRALVGAGHARLGGGALDAAIQEFERARDVDRASASALLAFADALRLRAGRQPSGGDFAAALGAYGDALALLPHSESGAMRALRARALTGRGDLLVARYRRLGGASDLAEAGRDYEAALGLDSRNIAALTGRAAVFAEHPSGLQRAIADLDSALRADPNSAYLLRLRGDLHAQLGDPERAMRDYDASLHQGGGQSFDIHYRRGLIYLNAADYARAEQSFAQAVTLAEGGYFSPGADGAALTADALTMRARATWGLIDEPGADARQTALRAVGFADRAAALQPNRARIIASRCLARTVGGGQWAAAEGACQDAIALARINGERADLGYTLGAMGLLQLRWALAAARTSTEEQERLATASTYLNEAIGADNASDAAQRALHQYAQGVVLECLGRPGEAARMMRDALISDRAVAARFGAHRIRRCRA